MPRRAPQRGDGDGKHRAVEAVLRRQPRERGVGDRLRQHDERADDAGKKIGTQRRARDAITPGEKREEAKSEWRHGGVAAILGNSRPPPSCGLPRTAGKSSLAKAPPRARALRRDARRFDRPRQSRACRPCPRRRCAPSCTSEASTQDAIRTSIESVRERMTIGIVAPSTMPAASPPVRPVRVRTTIEAASIVGAISTSGRPATSDLTPFARAASADSAESAVSGPSTTALPNMPCSAIVFSAAASAVETKAGVT